MLVAFRLPGVHTGGVDRDLDARGREVRGIQVDHSRDFVEAPQDLRVTEVVHLEVHRRVRWIEFVGIRCQAGGRDEQQSRESR